MFSQANIRWGSLVFIIGLAAFLYIVDATGNTPSLVSLARDPITTLNEWSAPTVSDLNNLLAGPANVQLALDEIVRLQGEVATLQKENDRLKELENEYEQLLELFDYATDSPQNKRIIARVIGRDPSPLFKSIVIDQGTNDGVQVGMPVDSARGLVGQVFRTTPSSAMVILITDLSSGVPSRLSDSRATGLVHGFGVGNQMRMDWIPLEAQAEAGDLVLTSGLIGQFDQGVLVGRFPAGLVVGRVIDVERSESEILQRAVIQTDVKFNDLETVFVITDFPKDDLTPFENPLGEQ